MKNTVLILGLAMVSSGVGALSVRASAWAPAGARMMIYDFSAEAVLGGWEVEDDGVMGGLSKGTLTLGEEGQAVFSGTVSLENNGGFSSIQYYFEPREVSAYRTAVFRIKGDGKPYQFAVEAGAGDRAYYLHEFVTSGDWQEVRIPLADLVPHFRGDRLDQPNFPGKTLAQVRFFIANKKAETFRLEVDRIWLE